MRELAHFDRQHMCDSVVMPPAEWVPSLPSPPLHECLDSTVPSASVPDP